MPQESTHSALSTQSEEIQERLADAGADAPRPWAKWAAIGSIVALAVAALFWLFTVDATANYAKQKVDEHDRALQGKADKSDVQQGFKDLNDRLDRIYSVLTKSK